MTGIGPQASGVHISGVTLLVVDDDPSLRRALRRLLELEQISIIEAESGESAIRAIEGDESQVIDAVLTDLAMPAVFGHELIAVLREYRPSLPVVAMTGWNPVPLHLFRGPVLHKPFDVQDLIEVVGPLVLTRESILRQRVRQAWAHSTETLTTARRHMSMATEQRGKKGELMKSFIQLRERKRR
jgi:DNA-binding NtrC family response regulator